MTASKQSQDGNGFVMAGIDQFNMIHPVVLYQYIIIKVRQ